MRVVDERCGVHFGVGFPFGFHAVRGLLVGIQIRNCHFLHRFNDIPLIFRGDIKVIDESSWWMYDSLMYNFHSRHLT